MQKASKVFLKFFNRPFSIMGRMDTCVFVHHLAPGHIYQNRSAGKYLGQPIHDFAEPNDDHGLAAKLVHPHSAIPKVRALTVAELGYPPAQGKEQSKSVVGHCLGLGPSRRGHHYPIWDVRQNIIHSNGSNRLGVFP